MLSIFRVSIQTDKYPTDYTIQATNFATASARAVKEYRARYKGKKIGDRMTIKIIKGGQLLQADKEKC